MKQIIPQEKCFLFPRNDFCLQDVFPNNAFHFFQPANPLQKRLQGLSKRMATEPGELCQVFRDVVGMIVADQRSQHGFMFRPGCGGPNCIGLGHRVIACADGEKRQLQRFRDLMGPRADFVFCKPAQADQKAENAHSDYPS